MKLLFLYTELAEYFLACIHKLVERTEAEVHIVRWSVNREAPFRFAFPPDVRIYERNGLDRKGLMELAARIAPDVIYCSGWRDKEYLSLCASFRKNVPVIMGLDNKWKGTFSQRARTAIGRQVLKRTFTHCWVPGASQAEFARRLSFDREHILTGFYSCDYDYFHSLYEKYREAKRKSFPHRFIFAGRYYRFKGVDLLWKAFLELKKESPNDWELWCLGTGDIQPLQAPGIHHFGFVQPSDMERFIRDTGVFILPSLVEPWGVAVHEFSSAGFPILCSSEVGASEAFVRNGENGWVFGAGNVAAMKEAMKKIISVDDQRLFAMGGRSSELAKRITPDVWVETLLSVIKRSN